MQHNKIVKNNYHVKNQYEKNTSMSKNSSRHLKNEILKVTMAWKGSVSNSKPNKCAERFCKGREKLKKKFKRQSGSSKMLGRNQLKNKTCSVPFKIQINVCLVGLWKLTYKFQRPCTVNSLLKIKRRVICYTRYQYC